MSDQGSMYIVFLIRHNILLIGMRVLAVGLIPPYLYSCLILLEKFQIPFPISRSRPEKRACVLTGPSQDHEVLVISLINLLED